MIPFAAISYVGVVTVLGVLFCALGVFACVLVARARPPKKNRGRVIKLGFVTVSAVGLYKILALLGLFVGPIGAVGVANYHVFEGTKEVKGCAECHVMRPFVNDLRDPESETLAARHYRNKWIEVQQCYHCHTGYGLNGTIAAKMEGYRHLARYISGTYSEPIHFRGVYNNANCLHCHRGTKLFSSVPSHNTVEKQLKDSSMSCLNCHGRAHPTRAQRTPGSKDYERLIKALEE